MHSDPLLHAMTYQDELDRQADAEQRKRQSLHQEISQVIVRRDANALCMFSMVTDWDLVNTWPLEQRQQAKELPKRAQTLAEVLTDAADYRNGPSMTEVMQVLLNASASTDHDLALQAGDLIDRLSQSFVDNNL